MTVSDVDKMYGYDLRFNLHLVGNHIIYGMRKLAELPGQTKLSDEPSIKYDSPYGCPYEPEPWKYEQTSLVDFEEKMHIVTRDNLTAQDRGILKVVVQMNGGHI